MPEQADGGSLKAVHDASHAIGSAVIAINFVEQSIDAAMSHFFRLEAATFSLLPMLDFRSKMMVIQRDKLLSQIIDAELRARLHRLYDQRNVLAHGYVKFAGDLSPSSPDRYELRHPRHERGLGERQVRKLHSEAILVLGEVMAAIEEITEFLHPLVELRKLDPEGTPAEFVARLRQQMEELNGSSLPEGGPE